QTEELTVIARRGPFEVKFDRHEFAYIEKHLDRRALEEELHRVKDRLAPGQDVSKVAEGPFPILAKTFEEPLFPRLKFRFLSSPAAIQADDTGRIERLTVGENMLVEKNGGTAAKSTGQTAD